MTRCLNCLLNHHSMYSVLCLERLGFEDNEPERSESSECWFISSESAASAAIEIQKAAIKEC